MCEVVVDFPHNIKNLKDLHEKKKYGKLDGDDFVMVIVFRNC